jgi:Bacterial transcriptional activator domain
MREGNQSEALPEFECYRSRLDAALGLKPTARLGAPLPG